VFTTTFLHYEQAIDQDFYTRLDPLKLLGKYWTRKMLEYKSLCTFVGAIERALKNCAKFAMLQKLRFEMQTYLFHALEEKN
jgi:hypothetical protein